MSDILNMLWDSTDELHRRFDKFPPPTADVVKIAFAEEVKEFANEVDLHLTYGVTFGDPDDIRDSLDAVCAEAADVMVTILAALSGIGVSREQFVKACQHVADKNNRKTWETHHIREDGKIARRVQS